jgi:hypothetical protein
MPGVPHYHVLALEDRARDSEVDELARLGAHIARQLGRELADDEGAFTIILNGERASRRPWAHVHILPVRTPAEKRRAFAFLMFKGPLRRAERWLGRTPA